jgi:hypothetical protein
VLSPSMRREHGTVASFGQVIGVADCATITSWPWNLAWRGSNGLGMPCELSAGELHC